MGTRTGVFFYPESRSWNWTIFLSFKDGVEWAFLSPREDHDMPPETTAKLLESQVVTMKFLKLNSLIPVPEVFNYSSNGPNTIRVPFILMSKAPGFPLSMISSRKPRSLFEEDGEYRVKECLSPALIWHQRDYLGDNVARGPFQHDLDYYQSLLSVYFLHVKELLLEQHAFFALIPELREFETFLAHQSIVIDSKSEYPLRYPDLSTGNVFVDNDLNITYIIDWAFSSTVPISTLLTTLSLPYPRDEVDTTLLFTRLVTLDGLQDYRYFTELYTLVYKPEDEINIPRLFKGVQKEIGFVELAKTLTEDDRPASEIKKDEEDYFRFTGSGREAIARKLTVVAELSEGFVADRRLWQWIDEATA
ncbi:hypothetical protein BGZ57DRAFT_939132 [Hyaloscypha finlandica]|nr:hypothetical protein BGZ57DRAFT_939132 [Hyaloscypha finlandica]